MKNKFLIIVLVLAGSFGQIFAQGGSLYTRQGIGDNVYTISARRAGLGGLGLAAVDYGYISSINPAGWYKLQATRFETGLSYRGLILSDANASKYYSNYAFSGFAIGIPIHRDYGIVASLGIEPVSDVSYDVKVNSTFDSPFDFHPEDEFSNFRYSGDGGLSKFYIGLSYKLPFDFIMGASYEYLTGKIDYNSTLEFIENSVYTNFEYIQKRSYHGSGVSIGVISKDFSYIFNSEKIDNFKFAGFLNYVSDLSTDTSLTAVTSIGTIIKEKGIVKTHIPIKMGLGMSLTWDKRYLILLDYLYQPWSEYKFDEKSQSSLQDLHKTVLSVEYSNPDQRITQSVWDRVVLRGGLGYEQSQYLINGESISTVSVHAGVSFPLGNYNTIDFGFEYGMRGNTDNGLLKEDVFKANVSINFGELWFVRQDR